jgi:hypothetical protein
MHSVTAITHYCARVLPGHSYACGFAPSTELVAASAGKKQKVEVPFLPNAYNGIAYYSEHQTMSNCLGKSNPPGNWVWDCSVNRKLQATAMREKVAVDVAQFCKQDGQTVHITFAKLVQEGRTAAGAAVLNDEEQARSVI